MKASRACRKLVNWPTSEVRLVTCMIVLIPIVTLHDLGGVRKELAAVLQETFASVKRLLTLKVLGQDFIFAAMHALA